MPDPSTKKQRTLYIGNMPPGMASEQMVTGLFTQAVTSCEGFDASLGPPIMGVQLCGGGTYCLVEFRDLQLCETALQFNGMELAGRQLKINHPTGHRCPDPPTAPLRAPIALLQKYRVAVSRTGDLPMPTLLTESDRRADRKQRELFVGNLAMGVVTSQMLEMLFSEPLRTIPGNDANPVPPVVEAKVDNSGKFGFVEFRDEPTCEVALHLFNGMPLCGRPMHVARPAGAVLVPLCGPPPRSATPRLICKQALRPCADYACAGYMPPEGSQAPAALAAGPAQASTIAKSKVVCLTNLLSEKALNNEEEYNECVEDIRNECEKFGKVEAFVAPREGALADRPSSDVGKCIIKYRDVSSAERCAPFALAPACPPGSQCSPRMIHLPRRRG